MKSGVVPGTWWEQDDTGNNDSAQRELSAILGEDAFQHPKPVLLLCRILKIATLPDDIVLDSFAGSGSTGHAALVSNDSDGGDRRLVLVQQPDDATANASSEMNICEQTTKERVRRVMQGYKPTALNSEAKPVPGLGGEFTYARVGKPLFDEFRNSGDKLPSYEDMARYIWFTETSRAFDPKGVDPETYLIGKTNGTSYYLLYSPTEKDVRGLDIRFLQGLKDKNKRKVIYCEKVWMHRDQLAKFGDIRAMIVPFNLR